MIATEKIHPTDIGLPQPAIRRRRRSRRLARVMLTVAVFTGGAGWAIFKTSVSSAMRIKDQPPSLVLIAYALLIASTITLVLGLWYLLLAQVERLARVVDAAELEETSPLNPRCPNCGWTTDAPDRFCRHCGKPLSPSLAHPHRNPDP